MGIFLGTQAIYPSGIEKVYVGTQLVYQKRAENYTTLTISTAGSYTLNLYKKDTKETKIYVNDNLVSTTTTAGSQDISITTTNENDIVKIENKGNWYFDDLVLGGDGNNANLTSVDFSKEHNMTSIGSYAFYNCESLTSITIPSSVTSIGLRSFYGCSNLISITIPSSVKSIGEDAFYNCSSLTSITIPSSVTSIGSYAFYGCSNLTSITIPSGITSIGSRTFSSCHNLTSVIFEENSRLTSIGDYAFYYCTNLTNITIPSGVTSIGSHAFSYCSSLMSITIPNGVTIIENSAFYNCESLTSITIPSSVTSIGNSAFSDCSNLTSITIPASVTSIGSGAFSYCYGLKTADIYNASFANKNVFPNSDIENLTIRSGVITTQAFDQCTKLKSLTIGSGVTTIGQQAFRNTGLTTLTIPSNVTDIKNNAFSQNSKLATTYIYTTSSSTKITTAANAWFYSANTSMVIHAPSSLNATTSQNAYGNRWNVKNVALTKFTTYYDL